MISRGREVRCWWVYASDSEPCSAMRGIMWELQRKVRLFHQSAETFWLHNGSIVNRNLEQFSNWKLPMPLPWLCSDDHHFACTSLYMLCPKSGSPFFFSYIYIYSIDIFLLPAIAVGLDWIYRDFLVAIGLIFYLDSHAYTSNIVTIANAKLSFAFMSTEILLPFSYLLLHSSILHSQSLTLRS